MTDPLPPGRLYARILDLVGQVERLQDDLKFAQAEIDRRDEAIDQLRREIGRLQLGIDTQNDHIERLWQYFLEEMS